MKLLKQFVRGKPFKADYLAFDGWGLWFRISTYWKLIGLRSKIQPKLCELVAVNAIDDAAWGAIGNVAYNTIWAEAHRAAWMAGGTGRGPDYDLAYRKWWINYYTKLGTVVVDHFSKKLIENVIVELDLALEKGEDVNGDLLTYVHKQYRKDIK